jgi:hypothetical protein
MQVAEGERSGGGRPRSNRSRVVRRDMGQGNMFNGNVGNNMRRVWGGRGLERKQELVPTLEHRRGMEK